MSNAREIRRQIGSIENTKKITGAMKLVAASKMRKAQERMERSKSYATKIRDVIAHVAAATCEFPHPYLVSRETIKRVGYIVVSTDRGLCGGLNINLFRKVLASMREWSSKNVDISMCLVGRKSEAFFKRFGGTVLGVANGLGDAPSIQNLIGVVRVMLDAFDKAEVDAVYIATNDFINTMRQEPVVRQLLPLTPPEKMYPGHWDYIYEPDASRELLTKLLVRYIESQVYQGVIENTACEQSARMLAMSSATDSAGDLIRSLQKDYNKARQALITQEIAEICAGVDAL